MPVCIKTGSRREKSSSANSTVLSQVVKSQFVTSDASSNQSIGARTSEDLPPQAPTRSTEASLQEGSVVSGSLDDRTPSANPAALQASSQTSPSDSDHNNATIQSSRQFHLRDLPAELRRMVYSHVWPCYNNPRALLTVLRHDSKLRIDDLKEAWKIRERNQKFTVTIENFKAFKAMRIKMDQINHFTVQRDWAATTIEDSNNDRWLTLSGCHCTLRNYFTTIGIYIKQEASQDRIKEGVGANLAEILIRAGRIGNGGPTKLFIMVEALEPLETDLKRWLHRQFDEISKALGFVCVSVELSGGTVLQATWNNGARLTWS